MANDNHALPEPQRTQVLDWIHFGDSGEDERADDAIVKLTSATGRPICSLNAAWLKELAQCSGCASGPGSRDDERKALSHLRDAIPIITPSATGLSHAMRLVLLDALRLRDARGAPSRRAVVDAIAAYVGPTLYTEIIADRMFRLFNAPLAPSHEDVLGMEDGPTDGEAITVNLSATPMSAGDEARDAQLWRWFRNHAWVGTDEDGEINLAIGVGEPEEVECLTDAERERFTNDAPDRKDMPSLCQRIAECRALRTQNRTREDVPPEKARGCPTKITPGEAPRG